MLFSPRCTNEVNNALSNNNWAMPSASVLLLPVLYSLTRVPSFTFLGGSHAGKGRLMFNWFLWTAEG